MKTVPNVKTAMESDEAGVIDALKLAFAADPAVRWVWPDPQKYLSHFSTFARAFGGKAFANKSAHYIGNYCDKCGKVIEGGRIKLIQHKKEFHSY